MNEETYQTINLNPPEDNTATQIAEFYKEIDMARRLVLSKRAQAFVDAELPSLEETVKDATAKQKTHPRQPYRA